MPDEPNEQSSPRNEPSIPDDAQSEPQTTDYEVEVLDTGDLDSIPHLIPSIEGAVSNPRS
jgi:hypothetical protein